MGKTLKYVKDFDFNSDFGYSGSAGKTQVKGYARGGKCSAKYAEGGAADIKQDKAMIGAAVHKHEKAMHPGRALTKLKKGGILEKATGERYASKAAMVKHERKETPRMEREEVMQKTQQVRRGPAMAAGRDPRIPMLKQGGKFQAKVGKVMHEFGKGELHSGKSGKVVENPKQAIAIALSEARKRK